MLECFLLICAGGGNRTHKQKSPTIGDFFLVAGPGTGHSSKICRHKFLVATPPHGFSLLLEAHSGLQFRTHKKQFLCCPAKKNCRKRQFFSLVAGPGIAPRAGGYEPPEILLLHPAICYVFQSLQFFSVSAHNLGGYESISFLARYYFHAPYEIPIFILGSTPP
jgi:hypothetical protein